MTVIEKVAVPPLATVCVSGLFTIEIPGVPGGCVTLTCAVSLAVTSGPTGGVPVAVAVLVKLAVTFGQRAVVADARLRRHRGERRDVRLVVRSPARARP